MLRFFPPISILIIVLFLCYERAGSFFPGTEPQSNLWRIETTQKSINSNEPHRTQIKNGALQIGFYAFGRADTLVWNGKPISNIELILQEGSSPIQVELIGKKRYRIELTENHWRYIERSEWIPYQPPWKNTLVSEGPISIEISTHHQNSAISTINVDQTSLEYDRLKPRPWVLSILCALLMITSFRVSSGIIRALVLLPIIVPFYSNWSGLGEGLRLLNTTDVILARTVLGFSLLPSLFTVLHWGIGGRDLPKSRLIWIGCFCSCILFASHQWYEVLFGAIFLLSHWFLPYRKAISEEKWLWDALLLPLPIILGWGLGLFLIFLFRWGLLYKNFVHLKSSNPIATSDQAFLMMMLLPITMEWSLRDTYLMKSWSPAVLEGKQNQDNNWKTPTPFWEDTCGDQQTAKGILYVGGSSTGGAYQFATEPSAFFSGQLHKEICKTQSIHTHNYGNSDRDTHTISRTIDQLLDNSQADLIVLYVGHNDLGGNNPYTRKEREARENSILRTIGRTARNIRLIAGFDLLLRGFSQPPQIQLDGPPLGPNGQVLNNQLMDQNYPFAVPLEDAKQNLIDIANTAQKRNVRCLLIAQIISRNAFSDLSPYWEMEKELADQHPNIWFIDPRKALSTIQEEAILADNNHLTQMGHQRLAEAVNKIVKDLLSK